MFTGNGYVFCFSPGTLTSEELTRMVRAGLAQGYFVTGGFNQVNSIGNQGTVTDTALAACIRQTHLRYSPCVIRGEVMEKKTVC